MDGGELSAPCLCVYPAAHATWPHLSALQVAQHCGNEDSQVELNLQADDAGAQELGMLEGLKPCGRDLATDSEHPGLCREARGCYYHYYHCIKATHAVMLIMRALSNYY